MLLFVLLWLYARKERKQAQVSAVFLIGYGLLRFIAEFFREPDAHLGLLSLGMSMGQWLCMPMILAGVLLWVWAETPRRRAGSRRPAAARGTLILRRRSGLHGLPHGDPGFPVHNYA